MKLRRSAIAAAAATVLTLTACGASDELDDDSGDSSSESDDGTGSDDADTGSDDDTGVSSAGLTEDTFAQELTAAQIEAGSVTMDVTITSGGQVITAEGEVLTGADVEDSGVDMTMQVPGVGDLQMILVDGDFYMNLGQLSQNKFVVIDLDDASNPLAESFGGLQEQFDVAATTEALEDAIVGFEEVGPETVEGVEAEQYDVTVNTEDMLGTLGAAGGGPAAAQLPETITYSFWTDEDNLPVKMTAEAGGLFELEFIYSDWGGPVEITPPPANRISKKDPFSAAG
jgi:hypothetical protein